MNDVKVALLRQDRRCQTGNMKGEGKESVVIATRSAPQRFRGDR